MSLHIKMGKYFAQVNFVIEASSETEAEQTQRDIRTQVASFSAVVEASADEPVEFDEFGHAG